jgi:hypothetical protein
MNPGGATKRQRTPGKARVFSLTADRTTLPGPDRRRIARKKGAGTMRKRYDKNGAGTKPNGRMSGPPAARGVDRIDR